MHPCGQLLDIQQHIIGAGLREHLPRTVKCGLLFLSGERLIGCLRHAHHTAALEHAERADTGVPALPDVEHSVTDLDDRLYGRHPPLAHEKTGCQKADKSSIVLLLVCVFH